MKPIILTGNPDLTSKILWQAFKKCEKTNSTFVYADYKNILRDVCESTHALTYDSIFINNYPGNSITAKLLDLFQDKLIIMATGYTLHYKDCHKIRVINFEDLNSIDKKVLYIYYRDIVLSYINIAYIPHVVKIEDAETLQQIYLEKIEQQYDKITNYMLDMTFKAA